MKYKRFVNPDNLGLVEMKAIFKLMQALFFLMLTTAICIT
jgi:hypothetical protein